MLIVNLDRRIVICIGDLGVEVKEKKLYIDLCSDWWFRK